MPEDALDQERSHLESRIAPLLDLARVALEQANDELASRDRASPILERREFGKWKRFRRWLRRFPRSSWDRMADDQDHRYQLIRGAMLELSSGPLRIENDQRRLALASADVFVEKAQERLTVRARWLFFAGIVTGIATAGVLAFAGYIIATTHLPEVLGMPQASSIESQVLAVLNCLVVGTSVAARPAPGLSGYDLTYVIIRAVSLSGLVGVAAFFLASLTKALLHESLVLYGRRHNLRFGRLMLYVRPGTPTIEDLRTSFDWNVEVTSEFSKFNAELMRESAFSMILAKVLQLPEPVLKEIGKAIGKKRP